MIVIYVLGILIILLLVLVLYSCVRVGSLADKRMEELWKEKDE